MQHSINALIHDPLTTTCHSSSPQIWPHAIHLICPTNRMGTEAENFRSHNAVARDFLFLPVIYHEEHMTRYFYVLEVLARRIVVGFQPFQQQILVPLLVVGIAAYGIRHLH